MNIQIKFENIVGQEHAIRSLTKALANNQLAHAYLLEGAEGIGKKSIARQFAKALVCMGNDRRPCNECNSCMKVNSGNHPNIKIIEEDNIVKIDEIRELIRDMQLKPYEGNHKVYIICHADRMNIQAQNALLKTLEEPPSYATLVLLTTRGSALLPTITSRCQVIKLHPVNLEIVRNYLIKYKKVEEEQAHMLAVFSGGIIGRAINLLDNPDFYYRREEVIKICNKLLTSSLFNIIEQIVFFEEQKQDIEEIFDIMISWYRDLFVYKETRNMKLTVNIDKKEEIDFQASKINLAQAKNIIFIIEKTKNNLKSNVQFHLNIEVMLLNIQEVLIKW